jgi:hypothetical protein
MAATRGSLTVKIQPDATDFVQSIHVQLLRQAILALLRDGLMYEDIDELISAYYEEHDLAQVRPE